MSGGLTPPFSRIHGIFSECFKCPAFTCFESSVPGSGASYSKAAAHLGIPIILVADRIRYSTSKSRGHLFNRNHPHISVDRTINDLVRLWPLQPRCSSPFNDAMPSERTTPSRFRIEQELSTFWPVSGGCCSSRWIVKSFANKPIAELEILLYPTRLSCNPANLSGQPLEVPPRVATKLISTAPSAIDYVGRVLLSSNRTWRREQTPYSTREKDKHRAYPSS